MFSPKKKRCYGGQYYLHQKPKNQSSRVNESLTKQGLSLYNHLFKTRLPFQINSLGNTTKKGVVDHCKRISEEDKTKYNINEITCV